MSQGYREEVNAQAVGKKITIKKQKKEAALITGADKRESSLSRN